MKLGCPICNSKFTLSEFAREAGMKELIDLAAHLGSSFHLIYSYAECFRDSQWGQVGLEKRIRLIKEIDKLLTTGEFEYDGKRYRTDRTKVLGAIRVTVDAEKYGFRNHNYLKTILLGQKPERLSAEGLSVKEETAREEKRRTGPSFAKASEGGEMTGPEWKARKGIESLADQVGKRI
jgi:hypothetical protein